MILFICLTPSLVAQDELTRGGSRAEAESVRLFIRGDDFGYTHASNSALEAGLLSSTSVLVLGGWAAETAASLRGHPDVSVGVHLAVTSQWDRLRWGPASAPEEVPGLLAPDRALFKNFRRLDPRGQARLPELPGEQRALEELVRTLQPGLYRLVVHIAEDSSELRSVDSFAGEAEAARRHSQLLALESPRVRNAIAESGIELIGIRDLWNYERCELR